MIASVQQSLAPINALHHEARLQAALDPSQVHRSKAAASRAENASIQRDPSAWMPSATKGDSRYQQPYAPTSDDASRPRREVTHSKLAQFAQSSVQSRYKNSANAEPLNHRAPVQPIPSPSQREDPPSSPQAQPTSNALLSGSSLRSCSSRSDGSWIMEATIGHVREFASANALATLPVAPDPQGSAIQDPPHPVEVDPTDALLRTKHQRANPQRRDLDQI